MADSRPGRKRIGNRRLVRLIVAGLALIYGVLFVVLNRGKVRIHFVFFTVSSRLWVGLVVCLVLGALLGQALGGSYRRRQSARTKGPAPTGETGAPNQS